MTNRIKFTPDRLRRIACPDTEKRVFYQDESRPELLVQVTSTGRKSYYCRAWNPAKGYTEKIFLGKLDQIDLAAARRRARELASQTELGQAPRTDRRNLSKEMTFGEAFAPFITDPSSRQKKAPWSPRTANEYQAQFDRYLAKPFGRRKLSTLHRAEIDELHTHLGKHNGVYAANRVVSLISAVFNDARRRGWRGENPAQAIERFGEKRRNRFLDEHEIGPFIRACESERESGSGPIADAVLLALFTGMRRNNVCSASWEHIDLERSVWRLPDSQMKNRDPHTVHLSRYVRAILDRRYRERTSDLWVFPSAGATGHLVEPQTGITRIAERAGIATRGVNMHCLKHTFVTYADDVGLPSAVRKRLAAHRSSGDVTDGYTHTLESRVKEAYEQVARHMLRFAEDRPKSTVS